MQCTACHIESNNLRAYVRPHGNDADVIALCAACRVLNTLHRQYLPVQQHAAAHALPEMAAVLRHNAVLAEAGRPRA